MRYKALEGSQHGCCFEAHVLDTGNDETICECFSIEEAELIASALNYQSVVPHP
jgi:hypothetical protein